MIKVWWLVMSENVSATTPAACLWPDGIGMAPFRPRSHPQIPQDLTRPGWQVAALSMYSICQAAPILPLIFNPLVQSGHTLTSTLAGCIYTATPAHVSRHHQQSNSADYTLFADPGTPEHRMTGLNTTY